MPQLYVILYKFDAAHVLYSVICVNYNINVPYYNKKIVPLLWDWHDHNCFHSSALTNEGVSFEIKRWICCDDLLDFNTLAAILIAGNRHPRQCSWHPELDADPLSVHIIKQKWHSWRLLELFDILAAVLQYKRPDIRQKVSLTFAEYFGHIH